MKVSRFNADTNRVRNARLKQTRVRHQIAAINGPPTYLRTSVLTARKQQYVKNMGAIAMESNLVADYEAAVRDAKAVNYNSVPAGYRESFPNDDPPKNSDADMWSRTSLSDAAKAATVSRLWTEALSSLRTKPRRLTILLKSIRYLFLTSTVIPNGHLVTPRWPFRSLKTQ